MGYVYAGQYGPEAIVNNGGIPQPNLTVTVYKADGVTLATLYTDRTKTTTAANPTATDSLGNLTVYADPGLYVRSFSIATQARTLSMTILPDPAEIATTALNVLDFATVGIIALIVAVLA